MTQTEQTAGLSDIATRVWGEVGGPAEPPGGLPGGLTATGPRMVLPSPFDVTGLATASVAAATMAAAEFLAASSDRTALPVTVDSRQACAAFAAEGLFTPVGWERPEPWDPIAGNYRARDGWIRLHTNYAYHRAAVERLLGAADRESVAAAVAGWKAEELETAVVEAGGCAAAMRTREDWLAAPAGRGHGRRAAGGRHRPAGAGRRGNRSGRGDGYGRTAALLRRARARPHPRHRRAHRHQVPGRLRRRRAPHRPARIRRGARAAAGDDGGEADRRARPDGGGRPGGVRVPPATADVLVSGLRADALAGLGYDDAALAALNPALIVASLDAYGWDGPWWDRRGFDSLVQMSAGIAAAGAAATGADHPVPLPVQALDHGCGYLLAARRRPGADPPAAPNRWSAGSGCR